MPDLQPAVVVYRSERRRDCRERRLVLTAAGIDCQMDRSVGDWRLMVVESVAEAARQELADYAAEQMETAPVRSPTADQPGAFAGVIGYAGILMTIAAASLPAASHDVWVAAGSMAVGDLWRGQIFRPVTALTLHADVGHLLSNLAFGGFYGLLAGRRFGGGVGWGAIVLGGAIGNAATALFRDAGHTSIGASTAVFAALGILVADGLRPVAGEARWFRRMAPLIVGTVVLAMTGLGGERTDVGAHVAGFVAGLPIGAVLGRLPPAGAARQRLAAAGTLAVVVVAWVAAVVVVEP